MKYKTIGLVCALMCAVAAFALRSPAQQKAEVDAAVFAKDVTREGDIHRFIVGNMISYGLDWKKLHVPTNELHCVWRFRADKDGVQIFTDAKYFPQLNAFVRSLFDGPPDIQSTNHLLFGVKRAGVNVSCQIWPKGEYPPTDAPVFKGGFTSVIVSGPILFGTK